MKQECYYVEFGACACTHAPYNKKKCPGKDSCPCYVSENEYFQQMMTGQIKEVQPTPEEEKKHRETIVKNLSLPKSKKQLKYEQRKEDEKNGNLGEGYRLMDDPRFKDIFKKK